jgi:glycerate dehydrogenase
MPSRIVVLDAHTLNPGDLDLSGLSALGELVVHARTDARDVVARAAGAAVVLTNKTRLSAELLGALPALRYVSVLATGYDVVDVRAAHERGIAVSNVPAYGTESVAQATFALLLELCNHVGAHAEAARAGRWSQSGDFSYREHPLRELAGATLGIVGPGRIGRAVARIGAGFGMRVVVTGGRERSQADALEHVELTDLLERADVVSLHCPLTEATRHLIDAQRLRHLKPDALLINTARGGLVDEPALRRALEAGELGGAGLDVLSVEPPPVDHPLLSAPRCVVTPHVAWATRASRERLLAETVKNVRAFLAGTPRNVVNG